MSEAVPLWRENADEIVETAYDEHQPRKVYAMFSGGNDSTVLVDWARRKILTGRPLLDGAVHIDTGTAVPGVREFVEKFCADRDVPLLVYDAKDAYERLVLDPMPPPKDKPWLPPRPFGFPGPGKLGHRFAYNRLKERQIRQLIRDSKVEHGDTIMLLSGGRRAESRRRMANFDVPIRKEGATLWVSPLIDWLNYEMREYREKWSLPESEAAALCHRSMECTCGAFAKEGEKAETAQFYPEWGRWIAGLEERALAVGAINPRWGERVPEQDDYVDEAEGCEVGALCSDCGQDPLFEELAA